MVGHGGRAGEDPHGPALTSRGRALLAAAGVLLVAARLLGAVELAGLAAAALVAVGLAVARVRGQAVGYHVVRRIEPGRVEAGSPAQARLRFTNTSGRPARQLTLAVDTVARQGDRRAEARCIVPPLAPGETAEAVYELPTERRGVVDAGPLRLCVADASGLVEATATNAGGGGGRLVVHPRIATVLPLPGRAAPETRLGSCHGSRVPVGLDFFTLREYETGDDVRRVHWRSTARVGELMLRQDELPWEQVATVVLDTCATRHRPETFEQALEAAVAITAALVRDRRRMRFVTTGGFELEAIGAARWPVLLDHLAASSPHPRHRDGLAAVVDSLRRRPAGPVAAVMGAATPAEMAALATLPARSGLVMVAVADDGEPVPAAPGTVVVPLGAMSSFAPAWNQAVLSCLAPDIARR